MGEKLISPSLKGGLVVRGVDCDDGGQCVVVGAEADGQFNLYGGFFLRFDAAKPITNMAATFKLDTAAAWTDVVSLDDGGFVAGGTGINAQTSGINGGVVRRYDKADNVKWTMKSVVKGTDCSVDSLLLADEVVFAAFAGSVAQDSLHAGGLRGYDLATGKVLLEKDYVVDPAKEKRSYGVDGLVALRDGGSVVGVRALVHDEPDKQGQPVLRDWYTYTYSNKEVTKQPLVLSSTATPKAEFAIDWVYTLGGRVILTGSAREPPGLPPQTADGGSAFLAGLDHFGFASCADAQPGCNKPSNPGVGCDDDNACTVDYCSPKSGCVNDVVPANSPCGDGDACVQPGSCTGDKCLGVVEELADKSVDIFAGQTDEFYDFAFFNDKIIAVGVTSKGGGQPTSSAVAVTLDHGGHVVAKSTASLTSSDYYFHAITPEPFKDGVFAAVGASQITSKKIGIVSVVTDKKATATRNIGGAGDTSLEVVILADNRALVGGGTKVAGVDVPYVALLNPPTQAGAKFALNTQTEHQELSGYTLVSAARSAKDHVLFIGKPATKKSILLLKTNDFGKKLSSTTVNVPAPYNVTNALVGVDGNIHFVANKANANGKVPHLFYVDPAKLASAKPATPLTKFPATAHSQTPWRGGVLHLLSQDNQGTPLTTLLFTDAQGGEIWRRALHGSQAFGPKKVRTQGDGYAAAVGIGKGGLTKDGWYARFDIDGRTSCAETGECDDPLACIDKEPCTIDSCHPITGCVAKQTLADGTPCGPNAKCSKGVCQ